MSGSERLVELLEGEGHGQPAGTWCTCVSAPALSASAAGAAGSAGKKRARAPTPPRRACASPRAERPRPATSSRREVSLIRMPPTPRVLMTPSFGETEPDRQAGGWVHRSTFRPWRRSTQAAGAARTRGGRPGTTPPAACARTTMRVAAPGRAARDRRDLTCTSRAHRGAAPWVRRRPAWDRVVQEGRDAVSSIREREQGGQQRSPRRCRPGGRAAARAELRVGQSPNWVAVRSAPVSSELSLSVGVAIGVRLRRGEAGSDRRRRTASSRSGRTAGRSTHIE